MDKKEFLRKWATLFFVTGLQEIFHSTEIGEIPKDNAFMQQEYGRMVAQPLISLHRRAGVDRDMVREALATSYEFVYMFPYIADKFTAETITKIAKAAIGGRPLDLKGTSEAPVVIEGSPLKGMIRCVDGNPVMSLPSNIPYRVNLVADFRTRWEQVYYVTGLQEVFHSDVPGSIPSNTDADFQRMVTEPLAKAKCDTSVIEPCLVKDPYFTYTFPFLADRLREDEWNTVIPFIKDQQTVVWLASRYFCRAETFNNGCGLIVYRRGTECIYDAPIQFNVVTSVDVHELFVRLLVTKERPIFEPTSEQLHFLQVAYPDRPVEVVHWDPRKNAFSLNQTLPSDEWIPPTRVLDNSIGVKSGALARDKVIFAYRYLLENGGFNEDELAYAQKVGIRTDY